MWAAASLCAAAQVASAQAPPSLQLSWSAPAQCPAEDWVRSRIARYLGRQPTTGERAKLGVDVAVEGSPGGFVAALDIRSAQGRRPRTLRDADCVVVADASAFIIAQAIDPSVDREATPLDAAERARATRRTEATSPSPTATEGGAPGAVDADDTSMSASANATREGTPPREGGDDSGPDAQADREAQTVDDGAQDDGAQDDGADNELPEPPGPPLRVDWALGVQGALAWQPLPALAPGPVVSAAILLDGVVRFELSFAYLAPQSQRTASYPDVGVSFDYLAATVAGCAMAPSTAAGTEFNACAALHGGALRADASQLSDGHDQTRAHLAVGLGPLLLQRVAPRLMLRFSLSALLTVARSRFSLETGETVHEPETLGFLTTLGAELRF